MAACVSILDEWRRESHVACEALFWFQYLTVILHLLDHVYLLMINNKSLRLLPSILEVSITVPCCHVMKVKSSFFFMTDLNLAQSHLQTRSFKTFPFGQNIIFLNLLQDQHQWSHKSIKLPPALRSALFRVRSPWSLLLQDRLTYHVTFSPTERFCSLGSWWMGSRCWREHQVLDNLRAGVRMSPHSPQTDNASASQQSVCFTLL